MSFESDIKKRGSKKKRKKTSPKEEEFDEDLFGIAELFQEQGDDDDINDGSDGGDRSNFDEEEDDDDDFDEDDNDDEEEEYSDEDDEDDEAEEEEYDSSSEVNDVKIKRHMPIVRGRSSLAENDERQVATRKERKNEGKSGKNNDGKFLPSDEPIDEPSEGPSKKQTKRSAPQGRSECFISKDFIKKVGQLNNIINPKMTIESDASFVQISNIIELRVRQIIEEANKFYQKRKRYCINRFLNINDFTNSCHYLNVTVPYKYQVSLHPDLYSQHEGMKNWRVKLRVVSKNGFKNVKNKMKKKKKKKNNLQNGRKKKRRNNFNLSAAKIFKEFQTQQNRRTNCYREFSDGGKWKERRSPSGGDSCKVDAGPSGDKTKVKCSSTDMDETLHSEINDLLGAERENEKEEQEPADAAKESFSLPDDLSNEDNPEVNVSIEWEGSNPFENEETERNAVKGVAESGISHMALSMNDGQDEQRKGHDHSASDLLAEIARDLESEEVDKEDPLRTVKEDPPEGEGFVDEQKRDEGNVVVESGNVGNGDVGKEGSCPREGPHVGSGEEDDNLLHYNLYLQKSKKKIKNIQNFLLSDMQNVLPMEANMTIFWLFIQNRCKKRKEKKLNGQSSSVVGDYYYGCGGEGNNEQKKNGSVHFDYQCYEMLYRVDRRGRNYRSYRGYTKGGGFVNKQAYSNLDRQNGNIFLLPKFYPINKEYAILSKYILEIIKDIINYRVNFFDYNNILHIFTTSKEINKILANIFFFLFNELEHNLAFNNMYASLMLLILVDGIIKNKNIDTHFYCLQILKMLIHVILYEHNLKLKNIYLILLVKRKACDIMINFCSSLRKKNNNEIINIDYYLIYILSKLLTHSKSYTPNFLRIFFKKYFYNQNVYYGGKCRLFISPEETELNELFNFFFFHIYTLIQGSLYRIFKHMDNILVLDNAATCSYLNYLMDFIIQYADYHLPLLLSIMTVLGKGSAALINAAPRRKRGWKRLRGHSKQMHSKRRGEALRRKCSDRGNKCTKIRRKKIKKNKLKKGRKKKAKKKQLPLDVSAVRAYDNQRDVQKLAKRKNYLKHVKKIYDYYARQNQSANDHNGDDLDDRGDLISTQNMNTTGGNKKGFLTAYVKKRISLNKTLLQNMMHTNQLHANIAVNKMLCKILNKFEKKRNKKMSRRRSRDDGLLLYNSCYYFLYTL